MTQEHEAYFAYLSRRSRMGGLYRRYWLYPAICRRLSGRVLDVGCGIGDLLRYRPNTVGVDVNPSTVAFCRSSGFDARVMQVDVLPFEPQEFDGVVLDNVLEHIARPHQLLVEIRRVLRKEGALVVGVPGKRGFAADPDHKVFYNELKLKATLREAGFTMQSTFRRPIPIDALSNRLRTYCFYGVFVQHDDE